MGHGSRAFLAGGLGFAVAFVVACGGQNGLLDSNQASNLNAQLSAVSSAVSAGQCGAADKAAQAFSSEVAALPSSVNQTLARNLDQGASRISQLAARDCSSSSASTSSTASPSRTSSSPTTSSAPSTTSTNPTTSSTATNPPTSSNTSTSNGGAGLGNGNGKSNGGAGAGGN